MLGRCLVSACKRGNLDIIVVVLGAGTKKQRTTDSINLINYTFNNYQIYNFENMINSTFDNFTKNYSNTITINKSFTKPTFSIDKKNFCIPINKKDIKNSKISIYTLNKIDSPITKNSKIGIIQLLVNSKPILSIDIKINEDIHKSTFSEYFIYILKNFAK